MASWTPASLVPALSNQNAIAPQTPVAPQTPPYRQAGYVPPYAANVGGVYSGPSQQGMAIAGLVLAFFMPLLGLIFSLIALSGMKKNRNDEGRGLAVAGLVISLIWIALACVWFLLFFVIFGAAAAASAHG
jgi:hypothetical protein